MPRLTDEQLAQRQEGLGASEALAYCGKDPRTSPLQLYLRKIGEAGERPPEDPRQEWGHRLEPVVRDWLGEELGREVLIPPETTVSLLHPFLFANLDGYIVPDRPPMPGEPVGEGVEIKTGDKFTADEFGEVETDAVPIRYVLQCMHSMVVTGFRRFHLGALLGGNDARHYVIDYDAELAAMLVDRARAFWAQVQARTPPDPSTLHDADKRWPRSSELVVTATPGVILALEELKKLRAAEKIAGEQADQTELTLKAYMGEAASLTDAQGRRLATWKSQSRESLDTKALTADHPELAAEYRRVSSFRVFRLK